MKQPQTHRRCPKCETLKGVGDFYKVGRGYSGYCKPCQQAYKRSLPGYTGQRTRALANRKQRRWAGGATPKPPAMTQIERSAREMWRNAHRRSITLRREVTLSEAAVLALLNEFCETHEHSFETLHPLKPSLDRIDNSKGYHDDNVRIVWFIHNLARNRFSDAQVLDFCKRFISQYGKVENT